MTVSPISLVVDDGLQRYGLQPWIGDGSNEPPGAAGGLLDQETLQSAADSPPTDSPLGEFRHELEDRLADLLVQGLRQGRAEDWLDLATRARELGFTRLVEPLDQLAATLLRRQDQVRWSAEPALRHVRQLCLLSRIADE